MERQLQTSDSHSFGGSTPSIHNQLSETNNKSEYTSKSHSANDTNSMRCYYDIEKIDFNTALFLNCQEQSSSESSSSTDNSIYYSDTRESDADLKENNTLTSDETLLLLHSRRASNPKSVLRCKNSVENLSEDSGYGDFPSIKNRSKSIPNLNQDQLIEEDEELIDHKSFDDIHCHYNQNNKYSNKFSFNNTPTHSVIHSKNRLSTTAATATITTTHKEKADGTKIDSTKEKCVRSLEHPTSIGESKNNFRENHWNGNHFSSSATNSISNNKKSSSSNSLQSIISASLPDILDHFSVGNDQDNEQHFYCNAFNSNSKSKSKKKSAYGDLLLTQSTTLYETDSFSVSSVPNNLNIYSKCASDGDLNATENDSDRDEVDYWNSNTNRNPINSNWSSHQTNSVASKNFDLGRTPFGGDIGTLHQTNVQPQTFRQQKIINSSYNNLTILDYSGSSSHTRGSFNSQLRMMADKQKRLSNASSRSGSGEFSKCNFLLDEISAHFDRNLSILNDKNEDNDPIKDLILETKEIKAKPPQPPPRKLNAVQKSVSDATRPPRSDKTKAFIPIEVSTMPKNQSPYSFDRDPTNLKTCYADSLEQCNFEITNSSNSINVSNPTDESNSTNFTPTKHSTPVKRDLVASTPNLFLHKNDTTDAYLHVSSTHNSLNPLPQSGMPEKMKGILSAGSRNSLGKGVSFYPYVSEISWREQSSVEDAIDDNGDSSNTENETDNDSDSDTGSETDRNR